MSTRNYHPPSLQDINASTFIMRHIPYVIFAGLILLLSMYRPIVEYTENDYVTNLWAVLVFSILLASMLVYRRHKKNSHTDVLLDTFLLRILHVNAIAFALTWSCMLSILYFHASQEYQLLIIVLASGISVAAFPILVVFKYVFVILVSIMLWPFIVAQFFLAENSLVAGVLSLFWGTLIIAANKMGMSIRALLYLQDANLDLVHRMADANVDLEELNRTLQQDNIFRKKSVAMFREKSQFLEQIMDATSDGIVVFDKQGGVLRINSQVCRISGYCQEELSGRHYTDNIFPDSDPELMAMVHAAKTRLKNFSSVPSWLLSKSHELKELKVSISVLQEQGELVAIVCTLADNTKEKELERLKDEFVSNISHELRTPLTSIHGSLRLLESGVVGSKNGTRQDMLSIAVSNSRRLMGMIDELLDVSKLNTGGMSYHYELCGACELTREAVDAIQGFAANHHVKLRLINCLDVTIRVDKKRFIQVLFNIVSNAIKYTPSELSVVVDMFMHEDYLRIQVIDQGEGIAETFQPYLFERYRQDHRQTFGKQPGTGLGLNIARQMIESMGGHIAYKTEMGQGTSFFIDIPPADKN
ncbi:MAG: PAS domain-containing sensor histidine kinase [Gammaproteobacteria bacterium]|nr:PAS domain-containing sensor histidine kinase [Gammaproteobacteria bacterium]